MCMSAADSVSINCMLCMPTANKNNVDAFWDRGIPDLSLIGCCFFFLFSFWWLESFCLQVYIFINKTTQRSSILFVSNCCFCCLAWTCVSHRWCHRVGRCWVVNIILNCRSFAYCFMLFYAVRLSSNAKQTIENDLMPSEMRLFGLYFVYCMGGWVWGFYICSFIPFSSTQLIFGFISYAFVAFQKIVIVTLTSIRQFDRWHFGGMRERSMIRTR